MYLNSRLLLGALSISNPLTAKLSTEQVRAIFLKSKIHPSVHPHLWMLLLKEAEDTLQITYNNYQYQLCLVLSHFKYARVWAPLEDAQSEFSCLRQLLPTVCKLSFLKKKKKEGKNVSFSSQMTSSQTHCSPAVQHSTKVL